MPYKPKPRPKNAYESGRAAVSSSWGETRPVQWIHGQLRLINRLSPAGLTEYQRGRRDGLLAELAKRGEHPQ